VQALRVLTENTSQLIVAQGSALGAGGLFWLLFPWIVCLLSIWFAWHANGPKLGRRGLIVTVICSTLFCLVFDFAGGARFFIHHTLTLSRDSGQAISEERWFGKLTEHTVYDMHAIQYAQLEFGSSGTKRVIFVMANDSVVVPLRSAYTDEQGYYAVVNGINRFLGVEGKSAPAGERDQ